MNADIDHEAQLFGAIAARLRPAGLASRREGELKQRLFERIRASALAHLEYTTVRREDGAWSEGGVASVRTLRANEFVRVDVVRLANGVALPWDTNVVAQEVLVIDGTLLGEPGNAPHGLHAYGVRQRGAPGAALRAGDTGALVYVRQLLVDTSQLPELEAHWWRLATQSSKWVVADESRWRATSEGVEVLPLRGDSQVVSMLVRFAPGASVADHHHELDEDCLVLEGEMFLGDILLRAGDYQLAPAGGSHFGEGSELGGLFFFHGSLDPVLTGASPALNSLG